MTLAAVPNQLEPRDPDGFALRASAALSRRPVVAIAEQAPREALRPLTVLKFGSSVLRSPADAPEAVSEIYQAVRAGHRVLAVVSAFQGVTDRLLAEARALGASHDNAHLPHYVGLGEEASAATLAIACDRAGLGVRALSCAELGLVAEGERENAEPTGLNQATIEAAFADADVVIVPGFTARDRLGRTVLLGRGGSDLSAAFIAQAMGAERLRLIKDVDGVYDRDPKASDQPLRFERITWAASRRVVGRLVQPRALDFAEAHGLAIEVAAVGGAGATEIGAVGRAPARPRPAPVLRIAVAGCGVVGGGVIERLRRRPDAFEVVGVLVRDLAKPRDVDVEGLLTAERDQLIALRPDVVVDALSQAPASLELMDAALRAGLNVVSANKQAVIAARAWLEALAERHHARLLYSAAVGGGAPLIELVGRARAAGPIASVEGVLNGTVNYMLGRIAAGESFTAALAAAQGAGLAEEDPSADLDGRDASAKLRILAFEAFGLTLSDAEVARAPLDEAVAAGAAGGSLKQVSRLGFVNGRLQASVGFAEDPAFAAADSDRNLLRVTGADGRVWTARGRGAGRWPTTESVFADLTDVYAERARSGD